MAQLYFSEAGDIKLSRQALKGGLFRIRNGIYADTADPAEQNKLMNENWMDVASYLFPNALLVDRSALELKPANGRIYLLVKGLSKRRIVTVGPLHFDVSGGNVLSGIEQISPHLKRSNQVRSCLENLAPSRQRNEIKRTLGAKHLETELIKLLHLRGEPGINALREAARKLAPQLGLVKEFKQLNNMIAALLKTHPAEGVLQTGTGIAHANGEPFDTQRIEQFKLLALYLTKLDVQAMPFKFEQAAWRNLIFFESYFSNYIEGTEFTLEEAEQIVFERKPDYQRHADSHDVLAHADLAGDMSEMCRLPESPVELIDILKTRHHLLMAKRPDKRPGAFKQKTNKAVSSIFVEPHLLEGTLVQGFSVYKSLPAGFQRALFIHFLVSECHPFDDGNGRLARIMMNAELVAQEQHKIVIPIVHRESYLNGLRRGTRESHFRAMVKVLHQMQCYTASLDWHDYGEVRDSLLSHAADKEPNEGVAVFNKVIARLGGAYPVD
jgi:hypothetical protein